MGEELPDILRGILSEHPEKEAELDRVLGSLRRYGSLLRQWNRTKNLVSRETLADLDNRHFGDSVQLLALMGGRGGRILDLGSGAGLPGIPIAIVSPTFEVTLVEANGRKVAFMGQAARDLGLKLDMEQVRIESYKWPHPQEPDFIVSRAFARLPALLAASERFFGPHTRALFHKGREYSQEIAESRADWRYDVIVHPSRVAPDGAILEITGLSKR
jgi:16S rRNA (guanine527-N7)-methyltransferase